MPELYETIDVVRAKASDYSGHCTFEFSQALPPYPALIGSDPLVTNGVCQGLVNRWIAAHAAGGSLWNELYSTDRRGRHQFNSSLFNRIINEQRIGSSRSETSRGGVLAQLQANERWLAVRGLIPWESSSLKASGMIGQFSKASEAARQLARAIVLFKPTDGAYLNIALQTSDTTQGGHAVGAFIGGPSRAGTREILFFDPNVGEFWFEDINNFCTWLVQGLLRTLSTKANYDYKAFSINAFAQRARSFRKVA